MAAAEFGSAIERLARAYEADADPRRDLIQDIHVALWRSLSAFDGRCSLRTWVYRVAHNAAASHAQKRRRWRPERGANLEALANVADANNPEATAGERQILAQLMAVIHTLGPPTDRWRCSIWKTWTRRPSARSPVSLRAPSPPRSTALRRSSPDVSLREAAHEPRA